jgi:hypothetical protein
MWTWIQENGQALQFFVSLTMLIVWVLYLNIFLASFKRQTRSSLLITRAGARDMEGRCIVSNMGSEPAYLMDVLAEVEMNGTHRTFSAADRLELWDRDTEPGAGVSAIGPIDSGSYVDIGSFDDILQRAGKRLGTADGVYETTVLKLIVIAATSQARDIVAAFRSFEFSTVEGTDEVRVIPVEIEAEQVRSRRQKKRIRALLKELQHTEIIERDVLPEVTDRPENDGESRGAHT